MFDAGLLLLGAVKSIPVRHEFVIQFQLFFFQRLVDSVTYSIVNTHHAQQ